MAAGLAPTFALICTPRSLSATVPFDYLARREKNLRARGRAVTRTGSGEEIKPRRRPPIACRPPMYAAGGARLQCQRPLLTRGKGRGRIVPMRSCESRLD